MAILIENDGKIEKRKPKGFVYDTQDLKKIFGEYFQLTDMGMFIVVSHDASKTSALNNVASLFLRYPVYGIVLLISGSELSNDFPIKTKENMKYSSKDFDEGTLNLIQETLMTYQAVMYNETKNQGQGQNKEGKILKYKQNDEVKVPPNKYLLIIDPKKLKNQLKTIGEDSEEAEFNKTFYLSSFDKIKKAYENNIKLSKLILFEADEYVISFNKYEIPESLKIMLQFFTETEDFEKCALLRDVIKKEEENGIIQDKE